MATRHTFPEQHKVLRLLLQKVVHPNDVLSSTSIFQVAIERMTKDMTASASTTLKIRVVAPPDGEFSLMAPNASIAQKCCGVPVGLLIGRPVSKSHQLQCKESSVSDHIVVKVESFFKDEHYRNLESTADVVFCHEPSAGAA